MGKLCGLNTTRQTLYQDDDFLFGTGDAESSQDLSLTSLHETVGAQLFPPRGQERPTLRMCVSEPSIDTNRGLDKPRDYLREQDEYKRGLSEVMAELDRGAAKRRYNEHREKLRRKNNARMLQSHQQSLAAARSMAEKPAWITKNISPPYFESPTEKMDAGGYDESRLPKPCDLTGDTRTWKAHNRNDKMELLAEFGTKKYERMGPSERKVADKLERTLTQIRALEKQDALNNSIGSIKRKNIERALPPHSALRKDEQRKPVWKDQQSSTHTLFSKEEPYKPGQLTYDTGLSNLFAVSDRAMDGSRGIMIGGEGSKSHWRSPKSPVVGTTRRKDEVQALMRQWLPKKVATCSLQQLATARLQARGGAASTIDVSSIAASKRTVRIDESRNATVAL